MSVANTRRLVLVLKVDTSLGSWYTTNCVFGSVEMLDDAAVGEASCGLVVILANVRVPETGMILRFSNPAGGAFGLGIAFGSNPCGPSRMDPDDDAASPIRRLTRRLIFSSNSAPLFRL